MGNLIRNLVGIAVLFLLTASAAQAGVVKRTAKTVKFTAKVASQPARHPVKDAKAVACLVAKVVW